jgi:hypothetical protein
MAARRIDGARALCAQRWIDAGFKFDLDSSTWDELLTQHEPGVILEAIKFAKGCVDPRPERAYEYFLRKLQHAADIYEGRGINLN